MKKIYISLLIIFVFTIIGCSKDSEVNTIVITPVETPLEPSEGYPTALPENPVSDFTKEKYANGFHSYVNYSYEEKTEILGLLEAYAVKNHLTGLSLYDNASYMMYHESVVKGSDTYIPGYGFGILREGNLNAPLETETNPLWQWYYHKGLKTNVQSVNVMNDKSSDVAELNSYTSSTYWGTKLNDTKDGYEWFGIQSSSNRPIPVDPQQFDDQVYATKYKFELKVGSEYKYNTNSTISEISAFDGREVALEDYVTPYIMLFSKQFGTKRAQEFISSSLSINGLKDYYAKSTTTSYAELNELFNENVGLRVYEQDGNAWMEVEFTEKCNEYTAMTYLSNAIFTPVPVDFIEVLGNGDFALGVQNYGNSTTGAMTPVDTYLSTGPYTLEVWKNCDIMVYKKNPFYTIEGTACYQIQGIHLNVDKKATAEAREAHIFYDFEAGKIHEAKLILTKFYKYIDDPRTVHTSGTSTYKLNLNSCTQEEWEKLFGESGTIKQTPNSDYWQCEPIMSNDDFLNGLSYAINRNELGKKLGKNPAFDYLPSSYITNPEKGIMYNDTLSHQNAISHLLEGTDNGYSLDLAKQSFKKAAEKLIADGAYKIGDIIHIEIAWMYKSDEEEIHNYIEKYIEDAFNSADTGLTIDVDFWVGAQWSDVYYSKMMTGQFDIAFGNISGSNVGTYDFFEHLRSDNASGYTINWGPDTSEVCEELYYDGMYWSYDSLLTALSEGGYFVDGKLSPMVSVSDIKEENITVNSDGSWTITLTYNVLDTDKLDFNFDETIAFSYLSKEGNSGYEYYEVVCFYLIDSSKNEIIITLSSEQIDKMVNNNVCDTLGYDYDFGIDIYYNLFIFGIDYSSYITILK